VQAGLTRFAEAYEVPLETATGKLLSVVEDALCHGLLEVAAPGAAAS